MCLTWCMAAASFISLALQAAVKASKHSFHPLASRSRIVKANVSASLQCRAAHSIPAADRGAILIVSSSTWRSQEVRLLNGTASYVNTNSFASITTVLQCRHEDLLFFMLFSTTASRLFPIQCWISVCVKVEKCHICCTVGFIRTFDSSLDVQLTLAHSLALMFAATLLQISSGMRSAMQGSLTCVPALQTAHGGMGTCPDCPQQIAMKE